MAPGFASTTAVIAGVSSAVGATVSIVSTFLLVFLWYKASKAKHKLRALTWAVPPGSNVGRRTFFASSLRKTRDARLPDDPIRRVQGGLGSDIVTLHTERFPDVGHPVTILSCHDTAWEAIKASKNVTEGDLLVTLLVLSLGNLVAAAVAVLCWSLNQSLDLVTNLAGNTLLVIAPLTLLSLKLLYSKLREHYASRQLGNGAEEIDLETVLLAIKESVEGSVRLLVPVFSMSYILKKHSGPEVEEGLPSDDNEAPRETEQAFKERLRASESVRWFVMRKGAEELYEGFTDLYDESVFEQTRPFRAAWLGKLLSDCRGESDRNRIISSTVLSHLRWSILHARNAPEKTGLSWSKLREADNSLGQSSRDNSNKDNERDEEKGNTQSVDRNETAVGLKMDDAVLLDSEGKASITFAKQGNKTEYYVPLIMLDTVSIDRGGGTLKKHWAAYEGRKQLQNNEELLEHLYEKELDSKDKSLDLWALVNKLPDKRTGIIKKATSACAKQSR